MDLPATDFRDTLARIERLARDHHLLYRLGVGRLLLVDLFDGDAEAYLSRSRTKAARFAAFVAAHGRALGELGLSEITLRQCIVLRIVADGLPDELVEQLRIRHLVELAKVGDAATRNVLALASVQNGWTTGQLRDAVVAVRTGRWIDGKPEVPGLQPPEPTPEPPKKVHLGRVVTQWERTAADIDGLVVQWSGATRKPTGLEHQRMMAVVAALEAKVAAMKGALG